MSSDTFQLNERRERAKIPEPPNVLIFNSLEDAKDKCDFWFDIDLEHPKRTCPHLVVYKIASQKMKKEFAELIKIFYKNLSNIRDYPLCHLWVVCKGRAIVVHSPSVDRWMTKDEYHSDASFGFHHGSEYCMESHQQEFNDIVRNADRLYHRTLLILPVGYLCTGQLDITITLDGEKVKNIPSELDVKMDVNNKERKHVFRPVSWILCNIAAPLKLSELNEKFKPEDPFEEDKGAGTKAFL